jgi:hypothetical protein
MIYAEVVELNLLQHEGYVVKHNPTAVVSQFEIFS